jgi:hypothetical protein
MLTVALSHLRERGLRLEAHEAVALARELLAHPCGIPDAENVQLGSDGSASCISTDGVLSVAGVAGLLQTLLPRGTPDVPPPLRYTIARGLEAVEAPPFGSLDEFSKALERFEKGPSRDVLRGVLQRAVHSSRPVAAPVASGPRSAGVQSPSSSRRWVLGTAAALAVSFVAGFIVMGAITDQPAAIQPAPAARVSPAIPAATHAANHSTAPSAPAPARGDATTAAPKKPVEPPAQRVSAVRAVRATSGSAFSPAFASDGTAIFFHTGRAQDARSAIEVAAGASKDGGDLGIMTIVDDGSRNYHAQPSPDGLFVAFDSDRGGERGIYVANRDGTHVRRVSGAGYAAVPTWSRNNQWLAYIRAEADKPSVWNLWVQPAAGGRARRLTNYRYGQTWAASWFPDDRRIAYSHEDALMVMDLQTGQTRRYRTPIKEALVRTPAVSPDGSKIIFQVFHHGAWLLDLADGSMQRVLTDPTAEEFSWAPDGHRVAFHSRRDGRWGIYVLSRG